MRKLAGYFAKVWRTRTLFGKALALVCVVTICALVLKPSSEPVFGGRTLSSWLEEYKKKESPEARAAILQIGERAVPRILKAFETNSGGLHFAREWKISEFLEEHKRQRLWEDSETLLKIMGSKASAALPVLKGHLTNSETYVIAYLAIGFIEDTDASLRTILENGNAQTRRIALGRLRDKTWTEKTEELVKTTMADPDPRVRATAFQAMLYRGFEPVEQRKFLLSGLADPTKAVPLATLDYLARNTNDVPLVLPEICALTNTAFCRTQALIALRAARFLPAGIIRDAKVPKPDVKRKIAQK